jgi:hypothetical protein
MEGKLDMLIQMLSQQQGQNQQDQGYGRKVPSTYGMPATPVYGQTLPSTYGMPATPAYDPSLFMDPPISARGQKRSYAETHGEDEHKDSAFDKASPSFHHTFSTTSDANGQTTSIESQDPDRAIIQSVPSTVETSPGLSRADVRTSGRSKGISRPLQLHGHSKFPCEATPADTISPNNLTPVATENAKIPTPGLKRGSIRRTLLAPQDAWGRLQENLGPRGLGMTKTQIGQLASYTDSFVRVKEHQTLDQVADALRDNPIDNGFKQRWTFYLKKFDPDPLSKTRSVRDPTQEDILVWIISARVQLRIDAGDFTVPDIKL